MAVLATFSEKGFVESPRMILARMFANYLETDSEQSILFRDNIVSFPATYQKFINQPREMADAVETEFTRMIEKYFEHVEVIVKPEVKSNGDAAIYISVLAINAAGEKAQINNIAAIDPTGAGVAIELNNYGDARRYLRGELR